jgi:hypothetical protein
MITATFFAGVVIGVAATLLYAVYLAARPKRESQANVPSAVGVSLSGKPDHRVEAYAARQLNEILQKYEGTRQ